MTPEELDALSTDDLLVIAVQDVGVLELVSPERVADLVRRADELMELLVNEQFHAMVTNFGETA